MVHVRFTRLMTSDKNIPVKFSISLFDNFRKSIPIDKNLFQLNIVEFRYFQMPEVIEANMSTSTSIPAAMSDCTDNSRAEITLADANQHFPLSPTLPNMKSECDDQKATKASVRLPIEYSTLPSDGRDLLVRLLEFAPERRIRSIFALQRIAFFMNFNFNDVRKKKVINIISMNPIMQ